MQHPENEIELVVTTLTSTPSAKIQQETLSRYFTHDAGFQHPLCAVAPAPGSREKILGIYQWYRVMSPAIDLKVNSVIYDKDAGTLILDTVQVFDIFWSPFKPAPSRLMVRLSLREENGLYYISMQEDFYHPEDVMSLIIPPLTPVVHFMLLLSGLACGLFAQIAQTVGVWSPVTRAEPPPEGPDGAESETTLKWD